ncbi:MAG: ABC transporter permease [Coriobacteriia bacterium]|nr:ABC transporter permease [Coriobacteriia bacterium]
MRTALLIARKDLRQRFRDRSALIYGILAPLGLAFIFSFVFNPIQNTTFEVEYVVVDEDAGPISVAFGQALGALEDNLGATVRQVDSVQKAEEQVETGSDAFAGEDEEQADAAFLLPAGLSDDVMSGQGGEMTVIGGAGSELGTQIAYSVAEGFAAELGAVEVAVKTAVSFETAPDPETVGLLTEQAAATKNPVTLEDISAATKQLSATTYMAAGMAVFFLFFTVSFGVSGLLEEKRIGTMHRLLAAPISRRSIVIGKALTSFALGIVSMTILVVATTILLDADWGDPLGVAMLVVAAVFSAMGILAIVAATAKTQDQAGNFQAIVSLVLAFLGGTFFSIAQVGGLITTLSLFTPHAWFLRGLGDLQGGEVSSVLPAVAALLAFGLVTGAIAWPFLLRAVDR